MGESTFAVTREMLAEFLAEVVVVAAEECGDVGEDADYAVMLGAATEDPSVAAALATAEAEQTAPGQLRIVIAGKTFVVRIDEA
jgi:hypothetical protein